MPEQASLWPTRKWVAARIIAIGALAAMAITAGGVSTEFWVALVGLIVEGAVSYLLPNQPTPGGVPTKQ